MPECVSVPEFVLEVQEDWSSPTTSSFTSKMISCRNTVNLLEEVSVGGEVEGLQGETHQTALFSSSCNF